MRKKTCKIKESIEMESGKDYIKLKDTLMGYTKPSIDDSPDSPINDCAEFSCGDVYYRGPPEGLDKISELIDKIKSLPSKSHIKQLQSEELLPKKPAFDINSYKDFVFWCRKNTKKHTILKVLKKEGQKELNELAKLVDGDHNGNRRIINEMIKQGSLSTNGFILQIPEKIAPYVK